MTKIIIETIIGIALIIAAIVLWRKSEDKKPKVVKENITTNVETNKSQIQNKEIEYARLKEKKDSIVHDLNIVRMADDCIKSDYIFNKADENYKGDAKKEYQEANKEILKMIIAVDCDWKKFKRELNIG